MPRITCTCPECGKSFTRKHHRQQFCEPAHGVAYNNRSLARGQSVVGLLQAWRAARHTKDPVLKAAGKEAWGQLCRLSDEFNRQDREAGRKDPLKVYRSRMAMGLLD